MKNPRLLLLAPGVALIEAAVGGLRLSSNAFIWRVFTGRA
jgi:uncharacterized MnhB-related membrane protein